ncbi:peptidoglycan DD-metalloendopeptidase family protein [Enhygromyxa salina]|uniref:Peptidase family M23 n=1 Tax=Enhygromyxa salina TaxID=215803 RepID=A0A2S9Y5U4_9BACT|nr:peptidoglycan DD-metalloendopeptidase family protein [Enhygromyxa salina]PRQ00464.1 Peptidase family M23 [Enhygromyxa salina]
MQFAREIVRQQRSRRHDKHGSGQFGAPRGARLHRGLDIVTRAGEEIYSPIVGEVVREALPYAKDPRYRGLVIRGRDAWADVELKLFYVQGILTGRVEAGATIGFAQNLELKYPGITNHVHIEARVKGKIVSPFELFGYCF